MRRLLSLLLLSMTAHAAVVITANTDQYPYVVLPGSYRNISVNLTGGTGNKINWSITSPVGFSTNPTLNRTTNAAGMVGVQVGAPSTMSVTPACTQSGGLGSIVISSNVRFDVTAQSVDDTSKTAVFHFLVCGEHPIADAQPLYQMVYPGQYAEAIGYVLNTTRRGGSWTQVSIPAGAIGANAPVVSDLSKRILTFKAPSVSGRFVYKFTSAIDSTKSKTVIFYVSSAAAPSYTQTTGGTIPYPCEKDPALTGNTYEVGPSWTYATPDLVPTSSGASGTQTVWPAGSILRLHNDGAAGSPTVYHSAVRISASSTDPTQPNILCGVPNATTGEMPRIDGASAVASSVQNYSGAANYAPVVVWDLTAPNAYNSSGAGKYSSGSHGPDNVGIWGLDVSDVDPSLSLIWNGTSYAYDPFNACIRVSSGVHGMIMGNYLHNCGVGLYIQHNNGYKGWGNLTSFWNIEGNHFAQNDRIGSDTGQSGAGSHNSYSEGFFTHFRANLYDDLMSPGGGALQKDRGAHSIYENNVFRGIGKSVYTISFEGATGDPYTQLAGFYGKTGDTDCSSSSSTQSPWCQGEDSFSPDLIAGLQEDLYTMYLLGNVDDNHLLDARRYKLSDSGTPNYCGYYNCTEISDHLGTYNFVSNSILEAHGRAAAFETVEPSGGQQQPYKAQVNLYNNNFYATNQSGTSVFGLIFNIGASVDFGRNLFNLGTMSTATSNAGASLNFVTTVQGVGNYTDSQQYPLDSPFDGHVTGYTTASNFVTTATTNALPYNLATYAPVASSPLIDAGIAVPSADVALLPVYFQPDLVNRSPTLRSHPLTLGAVESGALPSLYSVALTSDAKSFLLTTTSPQSTPYQMSLLCTYSNGLTTDCGPGATLTLPNSQILAVSGNQIEVQSTGTGVIKASFGGAVSCSEPYVVNTGTALTESCATQVLIQQLLGAFQGNVAGANGKQY